MTKATGERKRSADSSPERRGGRLLALGALGFPLVVWALGNLFYGGDIGKFCDDYLWMGRDVATGELIKYPIGIGSQWAWSWRPLHMLWLYNAHALLWYHEWVLHIISSLIHLGTAWLLWMLLKRGAATVHAPAAIALAFLACPVGFEIMFWLSTPGTSIATAIYLMICLLYVRWARQRLHWGWFIPMFALAYAIPCWNEQPAAMLPALPALYLAFCPRGEPWGKRFVKAIVPAFWLSMSAALYVAVLVKTSNPGARGGADSFSSPSQLGEKILFNGGQVWQWVSLDRIWPGALQTGWDRVTGNGAMLALWGGAVLLTGAAFLVWWFRAPVTLEDRTPAGPDVPEGVASTRRGWWLVIFGLGACAASWIPFLAVYHQWVAARMCYPMLAMAAVAALPALDWLVLRLKDTRPGTAALRGAIAIPLAAFAVFGALVLLGIQTGYREKYLLDLRQGAQLRAMVPEPAERSIFVPLRDESRGVITQSTTYNDIFLGAWEFSWLSSSYIQQVYGRADLMSSHVSRWVGIPFKRIDERGLLCKGQLSWKLPPPDPKEGWLVSWEKAVPYVLTPEGDAALITKIVLERPDNRDVEIVPPQVAAARAARPELIPERAWTLPWTAGEGEDAALAGKEMKAWRWGGPGHQIEFVTMAMGGRKYVAAGVHSSPPGTPDEKRYNELVLRIGPSDEPRRLCLRAGYPDWQLEHGAKGDGVEFSFALASAPEKELARVAMNAEMVRARRGWVPLTVPIPPLSERDRVIVRVLPGPANSYHYDGCAITNGYLFPDSE